MWFLTIPCAVFLGAKWAQNRATWGAKWGMAGEQGQPNQQKFCGIMERAMGIEPTSEVWENCCLRFQIEYEAINLERERPTRRESAFLFVWSRLWTTLDQNPCFL